MEDIKQWVQEDDIFIVDICFRDSLELLEDLGIKTEMPSFMIKGQKQMSVDEINSGSVHLPQNTTNTKEHPKIPEKYPKHHKNESNLAQTFK